MTEGRSWRLPNGSSSVRLQLHTIRSCRSAASWRAECDLVELQYELARALPRRVGMSGEDRRPCDLQHGYRRTGCSSSRPPGGAVSAVRPLSSWRLGLLAEADGQHGVLRGVAPIRQPVLAAIFRQAGVQGVLPWKRRPDSQAVEPA